MWFKNKTTQKTVNFVKAQLKNTTMKGINFLTNDQDQKVAVQIDLEKYGELWEDFYDVLVAEIRKDEKSVPLDDVIKGLKEEGKLDEDV